MIKVLHVIDRLPPDGAERLLLEIMCNRSTNFQFDVLCLVEGGELQPAFEAIGVKVHVLQKRRAVDIPFMMSLLRFLRQHRPDVVHTHLFTADLWARCAAWLVGIPAIFSTVHSTNAWKSKLHWWLDRLLASPSQKVIGCAENVSEMLIEQGIPASKVVCIPNGVDLKRMSEAPSLSLQDTFSIQENVPLICLVGRYHAAKGHLALLPVLSTLASRHRFHCLFIGEGELREDIEQAVEQLALSEFVTLTGYREDVPSIMKACDIMVMPSVWEGLPMALLEGMACELAVVASRVGGIPDVVSDAEDGLLYDQGDASALEAALERLLSDQTFRTQLGDAAANKVRNHYSAAVVQQQYEALYCDALQRAPVSANASAGSQS